MDIAFLLQVQHEQSYEHNWCLYFSCDVRKFNHLLKEAFYVLSIAPEMWLIDISWTCDDHVILKFVNTLRTNNFTHKIFVEDLHDKKEVSRDDLFFWSYRTTLIWSVSSNKELPFRDFRTCKHSDITGYRSASNVIVTKRERLIWAPQLISYQSVGGMIFWWYFYLVFIMHFLLRAPKNISVSQPYNATPP